MNFRKFLHDIQTSTEYYTTAEAAEFLDLELERIRHLVRVGVLVPMEGGGRGRNFYFSKEALEEIDKKMEPYR